MRIARFFADRDDLDLHGRRARTLVLAGAISIGALAAARADAATMPVFTDVTGAAGIDYVNASGGTSKRYIVETTGAGACFLDYDRDGALDLYVVNGSMGTHSTQDIAIGNVLYRNRGDGTFADVTRLTGAGDPGWGGGCAVGDYDNDGDPDLYLTNYGPNALLRNEAGERFVPVSGSVATAQSSWSAGATFFDADGDGDLDLYVANYLEFNFDESHPSCYWKTARVMCGPKGFKAQPDALFRNTGNGTFTDGTDKAGISQHARYGLGVVAGDLDLDGDADLVVANDSEPNQLYLNDGTGVFVDHGLSSGLAVSGDGRPQAGMGIDLGDYDRDGDEDVLVTNFSDDYHTLYRNEGGIFFTDISRAAGLEAVTRASLGWAANFLDFDNDMDLDIFIAGGHVYPQVDAADPATSYRQQNLLLRNDGGGYRDVTAQAGAGFALVQASRGAAIGDYDDDGDLDLFVVNENELPVLLRNDGGNAGRWLKVSLRGSASNRDGIGAKLRLVAGGQTQHREHRLSSGYYSSHDPRIHFGLGENDAADTLEVRWPSGTRQVFRDLPADRLLTISEAEGLLSSEPLRPADRTPSVRPAASAAAPPPLAFATGGTGRVSRRDFGTVDRLVQRGTRAIMAGAYDRGIDDYLKALRLLPDWEAARDSPDALGFGDPQRYRQFLFSLYDNLGVGLMRAERLDECRAAIARALEILPEQTKGLHNLGLCHMHARRYDLAVDALERARALDPSSPRIGLDLGRSLANAGRCERAIEVLPPVLTAMPAVDLEDRVTIGWYLLGGCYAQTGAHHRAAASFREALARNPGHQRSLYKLGVATRRAGEPEVADALEKLYQARQPSENLIRSLKRSAPRDPASRLALGQRYLDTGQAANALREARAVLAGQPGNVGALALAGDAALALDSGAGPLARQAFERLLELKPGDPDALAGLAEIDRHSGNLSAARERFQLALARKAGHPAAVIGLARVLLESGQATAGLELVSSSPLAPAENPLLAVTLAELYLAGAAPGHRRRALELIDQVSRGDFYGATDERRVLALLGLEETRAARALFATSPFLGADARSRLARRLDEPSDPSGGPPPQQQHDQRDPDQREQQEQ